MSFQKSGGNKNVIKYN